MWTWETSRQAIHSFRDDDCLQVADYLLFAISVLVPCSWTIPFSVDPGKFRLSAGPRPSSPVASLQVASCMAVSTLETPWTLKSLPDIHSYTHHSQALLLFLYLIFCWLSLLQLYYWRVKLHTHLVNRLRFASFCFALLSTKARPTRDA